MLAILDTNHLSELVSASEQGKQLKARISEGHAEVFTCIGLAECREVHFQWRPWLPDPKDECLLEAALAAGGVPIVTHNLRDFRPASKLGSRVVTPNELVTELNLS